MGISSNIKLIGWWRSPFMVGARTQKNSDEVRPSGFTSRGRTGGSLAFQKVQARILGIWKVGTVCQCLILIRCYFCSHSTSRRGAA